MPLKESVTNLLPMPVIRVIHLREQFFLVGYYDGTIEMRDLMSRPKLTGKEPDAPILSFNAEEQFEVLGSMIDFCCK